MLTVFCRTRFIGFHRWKGAPESVAYLQHYHRHEFHVEVEVKVSHVDRSVEFITLRHQVDRFIASNYQNQTFEKSCEAIAWGIRDMLQEKLYNVFKVEVSEDGENGARYYAE